MTPAATAMTAMTLDGLSGGRFRLGLGVSGPQVVEGWHGQAFGRPLQRTREYVAIVRAILRREKPLEHRGDYYQIPYAGADASGLGKPLRSILHGRPDLPIYLAAVGPKNVALAAEIADGWIPTFFSVRRIKMFREWLDAGFRARGTAPAAFDIMPMVAVVVGDDVAACRAGVKARLALYVGGMGARGRNFYNDIARRYGYEEAARTVQDLYLAGRKAEDRGGRARRARGRGRALRAARARSRASGRMARLGSDDAHGRRRSPGGSYDGRTGLVTTDAWRLEHETR